jgi:hypothetical protein
MADQAGDLPAGAGSAVQPEKGAQAEGASGAAAAGPSESSGQVPEAPGPAARLVVGTVAEHEERLRRLEGADLLPTTKKPDEGNSFLGSLTLL